MQSVPATYYYLDEPQRKTCHCQPVIGILAATALIIAPNIAATLMFYDQYPIQYQNITNTTQLNNLPMNFTLSFTAVSSTVGVLSTVIPMMTFMWMALLPFIFALCMANSVPLTKLFRYGTPLSRNHPCGYYRSFYVIYIVIAICTAAAEATTVYWFNPKPTWVGTIVAYGGILQMHIMFVNKKLMYRVVMIVVYVGVAATMFSIHNNLLCTMFAYYCITTIAYALIFYIAARMTKHTKRPNNGYEPMPNIGPLLRDVV